MSTGDSRTAKGGILGRRKRVMPEPPCYVTMWRRAENGRPEQVRCLLSEARKYAAAATTPLCGELSEADLRGCRFIQGEPTPLRAGIFCGKTPSEPGGAWCRFHRARVYRIWSRPRPKPLN